jgi:DNA-binding NarL/FixJ family response regulator
MSVRILIVDDHALIRKGYIAILKQHDPEWEIVEAANGLEGIAKAGECQPDLILMDNLMPKLDGVHAVIEIRAKYPEIKIIMVSMDLSEEVVVQTLAAGVKGFIPKDSSDSELIAAIHEVLKGKYHLTGRILSIAQGLSEARKSSRVAPGVLFTPRETEILKMMLEGFTSGQIAEKLFISKRTVDFHRANLLEKSGTNTTAALIRFALKAKIID